MESNYISKIDAVSDKSIRNLMRKYDTKDLKAFISQMPNSIKDVNYIYLGTAIKLVDRYLDYQKQNGSINLHTYFKIKASLTRTHKVIMDSYPNLKTFGVKSMTSDRIKHYVRPLDFLNCLIPGYYEEETSEDKAIAENTTKGKVTKKEPLPSGETAISILLELYEVVLDLHNKESLLKLYEKLIAEIRNDLSNKIMTAKLSEIENLVSMLAKAEKGLDLI